MRSRWGLVAASTATLAILLASGCTPKPDGPFFAEPLVVDELDPADSVVIEDGYELAVGAESPERVVAQWQGPDDGRWSAPETVVEGPGLDADALSLVGAGRTIAVGVSWYDADDDERETYARTDAVICVTFFCDTVVEDVSGSPMLAADGDYAVALDLEDDPEDPASSYDVVTWERGDTEWTTATAAGPPGEIDQYARPGLVLLGDGALATVRADESGEGCRYDLWASEPRSTDLALVASTDPVGGTGCALQDVVTDGTGVSFYARGIDQEVTFSPRGDGWTDDVTDSRLLAIDADGGPGIPMVTARLEDGGTTAIGSPDGRRIVAQHRPEGESAWTRPVTVARSPSGQPCRLSDWSSQPDRNDIVYVVLCWPRGSAWGDEYSGAPPPSTGFALGSRDGRRWAAEPLVEPGRTAEVQLSDPMIVARGAEVSLLWRPGARAFEQVRLPLANPAVDSLTVTEDYAIRVAGNPDESRPCRPRWSVAPLDAGAWQQSGDIGPISAYSRGRYRCYGASSDEEQNGRVERPGRRFRVVGIGDDSQQIDGALVRDGDDWRFVPGDE